MTKLSIRLKERLNRSAFFFGAVLFHLVLFLMLVSYVIWPHTDPEQETVFGPAAQVAASKPPPVPPSNSISDPGTRSSDLIHSQLPNAGLDLIPIPTPHINIGPSLDPSDSMIRAHEVGIAPPVFKSSLEAPGIDLPAYKAMRDGWIKPGDKFVVPIYLAKYADGDWDCNAYLHDGQLVSGTLPNLMAKIKEWSNGEITGRDLKVIALDSPTILSDSPPFIFFTGHKDFHLTTAEVENLQKYVNKGGVIWGDSAFSGSDSRFDVAFHREMKRVIRDADLQFEPLSTDDELFKKSRFTLDDLPKGMNARADSIECIKLNGKLAVLYTPNDYSDMMTMLLLPGRDEKEAQMDSWNHWTPDHPLFTPGFFAWHSDTFFRNYKPASAMAAYKLSTNILFRLLHQYDDDLWQTP